MWTAIIMITAAWLVLAPAILGFGTPALLGSVLSGVLVGVLLALRRRDDGSFFWIAMVGLYNLTAGFCFGGEARWSAVAAGFVLTAAGFMALKAKADGCGPTDAPVEGESDEAAREKQVSF